MHRRLIKSVNWILAGILSILGFSGCDIKKVEPVEYGSPYATFSLRGKVTDKDGKPVEDINIKLGFPETSYYDSVYTNKEGDYSMMFDCYHIEEFNIIASDIDGDLNGSYQNDTIQVKITDEDYYEKGSGNWNHGSAAKEVDIVLKESK
jgi:putative lipoprotein (rSAM/lipoprotein system)